MFEIGDGWRRLAKYIAIGWVILIAYTVVLTGGFEPFVLIITLPQILGWLATLWKPGRTTYTIFGVLGLVFILMIGAPGVEDLSHPESALGFNFSTWSLLLALLMILVGVAAWTSTSENFARRAIQGAVALFLVGLVVSIFAALGLEDDIKQEGDVDLIAKKVEWDTDTLSVSSGAGVFVDNEDPFRHTFGIEELGIEVELPAGTKTRVDLDVAPGTYEFICTVVGHEDMKGTITVE